MDIPNMFLSVTRVIPAGHFGIIHLFQGGFSGNLDAPLPDFPIFIDTPEQRSVINVIQEQAGPLCG